MALHERIVERVWLTDEQKEKYNYTIEAIREHDEQLQEDAYSYHYSELARQNWLAFWLGEKKL